MTENLINLTQRAEKQPQVSSMSMTLKTTLTLVAALAMAGCSATNDRLNGGLSSSAGGLSTSPLGDPTDPTSVAYFNAAVGDRVLFAVDQFTLTPDGEVVLAAQADWLASNPAYGAVIEGHADEQGTREYNLGLGARRASAVQNFLISRGVAPSRLRTVTYGKERPIEVCSTEACYSQNRRAVTVLNAGPVAF